MTELALVLAVALSGQFDALDAGVGGRVGWRPLPVLGVEAEVNVYPADFPDRRPFSRARVEALAGATAGIPLGRVRPFARVRPGFVIVRESPEPFPCILIFPPPLACSLASGRTLVALDAGAGIDITTTARTFVRVDLGDRMLRYPGPVFDADRDIQQQAFVSHEFRFTTGVGLRF